MNNNPVKEALTDPVKVTQVVGPYVVELRYPRGVDAENPWEITVSPSPHLKPEDLRGGITGSLLRRIDFTAAAEERRKIEGEVIDLPEVDEQEARERLQSLRMGEEYLAWLAFYYVALVSAGERSVTAKLGKLTGRSASTMPDHLKRARRAGMLTTVPGRAGGRLTDKAIEILER